MVPGLFSVLVPGRRFSLPLINAINARGVVVVVVVVVVGDGFDIEIEK